jgi:hypothetical protein
MVIMKDTGSFTDCIKAVVNPDLRQESMRLRDRAIRRAELGAHFHCGMKCQKETRGGHQQGCARYPTVIPEPAPALSCDTLPRCFIVFKGKRLIVERRRSSRRREEFE